MRSYGFALCRPRGLTVLWAESLGSVGVLIVSPSSSWLERSKYHVIRYTKVINRGGFSVRLKKTCR